MSTTDSITTFAAQTQASLAAAQKQKTANSLGIEDFLTLMTTQLKNQDPLKPLEGTEFVAQLAQFGAVSGIQNMQTSIETLAASLRSAQVLNGATLVGHEVLASADSFTLSQGSSIAGELEVPAGADSLEIRITDTSGQVVRQVKMVPQPGTNTFMWDGLMENGSPAPTGRYDIEAVANYGTSNQSLDILLAGRVSSVTIDGQGTGLTLNTAALGSLSLSNVRRVM